MKLLASGEKKLGNVYFPLIISKNISSLFGLNSLKKGVIPYNNS